MPVIERGSVLISGSRIAAVGADVAVPPGAVVIDGSRKTLYPGLIDGLTRIGLVEIGQGAAGTVDSNETGDVNPHAKAWVAVHPHSDLIPVARANGIMAVLTAPGGGLISGQSALIRLAGTTPEALVVKTPAGMHMVFPTGRPSFDITQAFQQDPELARSRSACASAGATRRRTSTSSRTCWRKQRPTARRSTSPGTARPTRPGRTP